MAPAIVAIGMLCGLKIIGGNSLLKDGFSSTLLFVYSIGAIVFSVGNFADIATPDSYIDGFIRYWKFYIEMLRSNLGLTDQAMVGIPMVFEWNKPLKHSVVFE